MMEYPFKDLLPLDQALEREGYYNDWTHLDPEVFYSLTQISEYIKTKGYGVDVRLLIAQLAEHFGLKTTQVVDLANLLQDKFDKLEGATSDFTSDINGLVAQMQADKDAVIANATVDSEVILARGNKPTLGARFNEVSSQLDQSGTNAFVYGVIPNDDSKATHNTITLNNLLAVKGDPVFLPAGEIAVNGTITIGEDVQVYGTDRTVIKAIGDFDVISLNSRSGLEKVQVKVPSSNHTKSLLLFDGANKIRDARLKDIRLECYNATSTGIKMTGVGLGNFVVFCTVDNVRISGGLYSVYLEDNQATSGDAGWVNGNRLTNLTLYGKYGVYVKGHCAGNQFDLQHQASVDMVTAVYCEGNNNDFDGFIFDVGHQSAKNFILTKDSYQNKINFPQINTTIPYYEDSGVDNIITYKKDDGIRPLTTKTSYDLTGGAVKTTKTNFFGNQDNALAYIDKLGTVSISGGRVDAGGNSLLFDPTSNNSAYFSNPSLAPITIEIDLSSKPITSLYMLGINFAAGQIADSYKIEVAKTASGVYETPVVVTGNTSSSIVHSLSRSGQAFKIKITITKAVYHAEVNPNNDIQITTIYGASSNYYNSPILQKSGDTMYGHLSFNDDKTGVIMVSPNGTKYLLRINDDGTIRTSAL